LRKKTSIEKPLIFRNGLREKEPASKGALFSSIIGNIFNGSDGFLQVVVQHGSLKYDPFAVSLALAIGRYISRDGRHPGLVIIDEGFGSLDKAGRDDMIQELHVLGEHVARIILVSHQEEFAYAFSNRYRFKLVDGSSRVTLMDEE